MTGPVADPTVMSTAPMSADAAKRLGYQKIGICRHCVRTTVMPNGTTTWIHQRTGDASCPTGHLPRKAAQP